MKPGPPKKTKTEDDLHGKPSGREKEDRIFVTQDCKFKILSGLPSSVRDKAKEAAQFLSDNEISKVCDRAAFERYCQHLWMVWKSFQVLKKDGPTVTDNRGVIRKHPAAQTHKDYSMAALRFEEQFGLTPLSRLKVKGKPPEKKDELKEFLGE